jgi:PAS domain S-box-containing protein
MPESLRRWLRPLAAAVIILAAVALSARLDRSLGTAVVMGAALAVIGGQLRRSRRLLETQRAATDAALTRVRRLGVLATEFSAATTPAQVSEVAFRACRALGATFANIAWLAPDADALETLFGFGHAHFTTGPFARYPVDAPTPNADAFRRGVPVLLGSDEEIARAYPHLAAAREEIGARAWLAWPIVVRARPVGVLGLGFGAPKAFAPEESELLETIADHLGQALERARLLARAKESERRFRLLAENAPDLVYRYRLLPTRGFEYVSPAATGMLGYTPEEHYADPQLAAKLVVEEDRPRHEAALVELPGTPLLLRWRRRDGRVIWAEQRYVVLRDAAGAAVAVEGITRDVTERVEVEAQRERLATEREDLLQAVSHDFKTPLQAVMLRADALVRDPADAAKTLRAARAIAESARRMRSAVQDVVHLARLGAGALAPHPAAVPVEPFVSALIRRLYTDDDVARIEIAVPPDAAVHADPVHLERIVTNLLDNALKYSAPPAAVAVRFEEDGEARVVSIVDHGVGIAAEDLPHLFRRYFRGSRPTGHEGTGLGLFVARLLAEAQGGRVSVESAPGRGSTFRVHLPAAPAE